VPKCDPVGDLRFNFTKCPAVPSWQEKKPFDHWGDEGFRGALQKVCVTTGKNNWFNFGRRVVGFTACYAGLCSEYKGGKDKWKEQCWSLRSDETGITKVVTKYLAHGEVADNSNIVVSIQFCSDTGRCSEFFGANDWNGQHEDVTECPKGQHVMGFHGSYTAPSAGWDGDIRRIGVYCGGGGGSGRWEFIGNAPSTIPVDTKIRDCITYVKSRETESTTEWAMSVEAELSFGFGAGAMPDVPVPPPVLVSTASAEEKPPCKDRKKQSTPAPAPVNSSSGGLPGNFGAVLGDGDDGEGNSITVTGSWAHTVTNKVSSSFTRTQCESKSFTIPAGEYCYHWTMSYSPKNGAKIMVYSNAIECVPQGNPVCCPPGTYRTGHPTWDCDKEVYLCGDRKSS